MNFCNRKTSEEKLAMIKMWREIEKLNFRNVESNKILHRVVKEEKY